MNNVTIDWKTVNNYVVMGGSAIIAVSAGFQLTKVTSVKQAVLPVIFLLTGIAAFNCAIQSKNAAA